VSGQLHAPATLPHGNKPWYPLDRRLGGTQRRSEHGGEEKNSQPLPGLEPQIVQSVVQSCATELSRHQIETYSAQKFYNGITINCKVFWVWPTVETENITDVSEVPIASFTVEVTLSLSSEKQGCTVAMDRSDNLKYNTNDPFLNLSFILTV
jgi:hypothetical protein